MSARHTRVVDQLHTRHHEILTTLQEGKGIPRVQQKARSLGRAQKLVNEGERPPRMIWLVETPLGSLSFFSILSLGMRSVEDLPYPVKQVTEFFDLGVPMEVSMPAYRALVHERNTIEERIRRFTPGWTEPPRHQPSPFGADRFRTFDPTPHFEYVAGPLRHIGR